MTNQNSITLAEYTSLGVGGETSDARFVTSAHEALELLNAGERPRYILGYGTNSLISDQGLDGLVWLLHGGQIQVDDTLLVADAGCWWDDVVSISIDHELWGLEMMSGIPGGVGAAIVGNIAAYGQAVADTLAWVEIFDPQTGNTQRLIGADLNFDYRYSVLQTPPQDGHIVLRAAFTLSNTPTKDVTYQPIIDTLRSENLEVGSLAGRRQATLVTRKNAGSLFDYQHSDSYAKTAGSFFRNPRVDLKTAEYVMSFDETGKSLERLRAMNQAHSGAHRVSAAHVLLAAGFHRGQTWGHVGLNEQHLLKLQNLGGATAQEIYDVSVHIVDTVHQKLGITLQPEVRFLGSFRGA